MSPDEAPLIRLWKEKSGEVEPEDFSDNLIVQLGVATEALNRTWYERNAGRVVTDVQRWVQHPVYRYMAATLDGFVNELDAVFEAKFMLPWSFAEEAAAEKHMAQLQQRPVGRALDYHRRRQMDRDDDTRRRALPDPETLWHRTAAAADRSGSSGRHE
jgi:YqaJ-like viral recombinase domain